MSIPRSSAIAFTLAFLAACAGCTSSGSAAAPCPPDAVTSVRGSAPASNDEVASDLARRYVTSLDELLLDNATRRDTARNAMLATVTRGFRQSASRRVDEQEQRRTAMRAKENIFDDVRVEVSVRRVDQPRVGCLVATVHESFTYPYRQVSGQPPAYLGTMCRIFTMSASESGWAIADVLDLEFVEPEAIPNHFRAAVESC